MSSQMTGSRWLLVAAVLTCAAFAHPKLITLWPIFYSLKNDISTP